MMRYIILILVFFFTFLQEEPLDLFIKKELKTKKEWIRQNPSFKRTKPSFFNEETTEELFIFPIDVTPDNRLFLQDCENKLIVHFRNKESIKFSILKVNKTETECNGIRLIPSEFPNIIIFVNYEIVESRIIDWYKSSCNECPGNHIFPSLRIDSSKFKKKYGNRNLYPIFDILSSEIKGEEIKTLMGIYSPKLKTLKKAFKPKLPCEYTLKTVNGKEIDGLSMDLNTDMIPDIFWFVEVLNLKGEDEYLRIYLNIEGEWCCKWVELIEVCV